MKKRMLALLLTVFLLILAMAGCGTTDGSTEPAYGSVGEIPGCSTGFSGRN